MKRLSALLVLASLAGCERARVEPPPSDVTPSPNASILPAPLTPAEPRAKEAPLALRGDEPLVPDALGAKETSGVSLVVEWKPQEIPSPPRAPEVHSEGIAALRKNTVLRTTLQLAEAGRLRLVLEGRGFPFPTGTELRARADRLGHVLVFPGATEYRPAAPGTLRALFGDRRLDALPLVSGQLGPKKDVSARFGRPVTRYSISTKLGALTIDVVRAPELGASAAMFCRLLVELIGADPATPGCEAEWLPIRAHLAFPTGGIVLDVADLPTKKTELALADLMVPPGSAQVPDALTPDGAKQVATKEELGLFRTRDVDLPTVPGAPTEGLFVKNPTDALRAVLIDGVTVAWLASGEDVQLLGLKRGKYMISSRTLLGDASDAARTIEVPSRATLGEVLAQAPLPAKSK